MTLKELNKATSKWLKDGMNPESLLDIELMENEEMDCTSVIVSIGERVIDVILLSGDDTPEDYLDQMNLMVSTMLGLDPSLGSWSIMTKYEDKETLN